MCVQAACYMAAMDRLPEAALLLARSHSADPTTARPVATGSVARFQSRMQRDYLRCYIQLSHLPLGAPESTAHVATSAETPVDTLAAVAGTVQRYSGCEGYLGEQWQKRWRDMHDYVREVNAQHTAQHTSHAETAAQHDSYPDRSKPKKRDAFLTLDTADVSRGVITVLTVPGDRGSGGVATGATVATSGEAAGREVLQVRVREVDVEMLFSRKPFEGISGDIGAAAFVTPRHSIDIPTDPSGSTTLDLRTLLPGAPPPLRTLRCVILQNVKYICILTIMWQQKHGGDSV